MNLGDTIVAVSSPAGAGERAILRLSGPRAIEIARRVFTPEEPAAWPTHTALAGRLAPPLSGLSVPATLYVMKAPRSYTREDVVEFHVGAWPALEGELLGHLVAAGARPAERGEFTFRAFMSGRLDLAQAEAVMAVVSASTPAALGAAEDLLGGHLSREIGGLSAAAREVLALVEAGLDFSDQDVEIISPQELTTRIDGLRRALAGLGRRARGLETFSGRVRLVLAGRPNVGKSSLFNRLLEADRAIVSPEAGTTRDELRAALAVGGVTFMLCDVAGLDGSQTGGSPSRVCDSPAPPLRGYASSATADLRHKARAKALEAVGGADLVLVAIDATAPSYERTGELLAAATAPVVVAITKCDLAPADRARAWLAGRDTGGAEVVATSAVTGEGLDDLRGALVRAVAGGAVDRQASGPVVAARHRAALERAAVALARGARQARRGAAAELVAEELREAIDGLGAILGRGAGTDVLDLIFSRFCIGK